MPPGDVSEEAAADRISLHSAQDLADFERASRLDWWGSAFSSSLGRSLKERLAQMRQ